MLPCVNMGRGGNLNFSSGGVMVLAGRNARFSAFPAQDTPPEEVYTVDWYLHLGSLPDLRLASRPRGERGAAVKQ